MKTFSFVVVVLSALAILGCSTTSAPLPSSRASSLAPAAPAVGAPDREVYLSVRTDGHEGTGAVMDPYNASTQEKFDSLFKSFGPNTAIHLGPGTYHTRGAAVFEVKPYWKIRGAGYEVTRIIQDNARQIGCTVFAGRADGVEIEDLSIDCGFQNQQVVKGAIKANASAIGLGGSHIVVRRCLFKNYGSPYDQDTGENFAVFIGSADPDNGENLVVEDCIFAGMTPLLKSGQSVLTIAGGPRKNDLREGNWARGCIARRNHFTGHHYGCHGITMSGTQGGMMIDNVFEHFMGACIYHDTWPMRDIIISRNIMSDVNQGIRLTCNEMRNIYILDNVLLMNDGVDIVEVKAGVVKTVINHNYKPGNQIAFRGVNMTSGKGLAPGQAFVTSVPSPNTFTYALTAKGRTETADAGTGGFIQALSYEGCMASSPEAIVACGSGGKTNVPPTNFIISRNIIKPYSSSGTGRVPACGISVWDVKESQIVGNVIADPVKLNGNRQLALIVGSSSPGASSVICRDNYHSDGTPLVPVDEKIRPIESGLLDLPLMAGKGVALAPEAGKMRIDVGAPPPAQFAGLRLTHAVDPAGPAKDKNFAGAPGDYAASGDFLYIYTGDGTKHQWKRIGMGDY